MLPWTAPILCLPHDGPPHLNTPISRPPTCLLRPAAHSEAQLPLARGARLSGLVYASVYSGLVMIVGSYMLVLGRTVQAVFFSSRLCLPVASMIAA